MSSRVGGPGVTRSGSLAVTSLSLPPPLVVRRPTSAGEVTEFNEELRQTGLWRSTTAPLWSVGGTAVDLNFKLELSDGAKSLLFSMRFGVCVYR